MKFSDQFSYQSSLGTPVCSNVLGWQAHGLARQVTKMPSSQGEENKAENIKVVRDRLLRYREWRG